MNNYDDPYNNEILIKQNEEVTELCGCTGREKTWSRRVLKAFHDPWCFYYMHLTDLQKEASWTKRKWDDKR